MHLSSTRRADPARTASCLRPQEATFHTDAWVAYAELRQMGIDHRPRKGGQGCHAVDGLPWAHTVFGNLKTRLVGTFHGVSTKHLQRYLDEFESRKFKSGFRNVRQYELCQITPKPG